MTTNYERIKGMTVEEMTGFLLSIECNYYDFTYYTDCYKWLESEANNG